MLHRIQKTAFAGSRSFRRGTVVLLAVAAPWAIAFSLPGCKTGAVGAKPAISYTSPDWDGLNIKTLAFLGVATSTGDETDRLTAQQLSEQYLLGAQERFVILGFTQSQERAAGSKAGDLFDRAVKGWQDQRILDQFVVQQLCQRLNVDGVLLGDLSDWRREKVDFTEQGSSYTQIDLGLSIYSAKTGAEVWSASKKVRRDTAEYTPGSGGSGVYTDAGGVSRAQRAGSMTPEPPRAEEVLELVMTALIEAFPEPPAQP